MYRSLRLSVVGASDSGLNAPVFGPFEIACNQTKDLTSDSFTKRVGVSDSESGNLIARVTTGYFWAVFSDYPVLVRINGASATQHTLKSNNVAATSAGAPLPPQCFIGGTGTITDLRLAPISGATQTATVQVIVTGDPVSSYV